MKVWTFTVIAMTMMIFFQFAGFPTALDPLFDFMGIGFDATTHGINAANLTVSDFWGYLFNGLTDAFDGVLGILIGLASAGVMIGLLATGRADIAIRATFASAVLFAFIPTLLYVVTYAITHNFPVWATSMLALIFIPLTGGYFFALVEYVFGTD